MARKSIAKDQSFLYDGGGTSKALQTFTTSATLVAAALESLRISQPIVALRIELLASAASKGCVLAITEFADDTPAVDKIRSVREVTIPATDQTMTVDRAAWGLTTGTEIYVKAGAVVPVTPGRNVTISCASTDGSVSWYARVTALDDLAVQTDALPVTEASVASILEALGGGVTVGAADAVAVGATTTVVLAAATGRRSVTLTNLSTSVVYITVGAAAVSGKGIPLAAASGAGSVGGSCEISGAGAALAINGISDGAGKSVAYQTLSIA